MSPTDRDLAAPDTDEDDLDEQPDLFDDEDDPTVSLDREPTTFSWSLRWVVGAFAVLVIAGLTIGILVFNSAAPGRPRGAVTPQDATRLFLGAINRGDGDAAARISCDAFGADARSAARSGADAGISFTLVHIAQRGKDHATAEFAQHTRVAGSVQSSDYHIALLRGAGRWLVCGRS